MKLEIKDGYRVEVSLSRRNLMTLLAKLDGNPHESLCTIYSEGFFGRLSVQVQEDAIHYKDRIIPPGEMHPDTEREIQQS